MRDDPQGSQFYDEGWNDCVDSIPQKSPSSKDYKDGYKDCNYHKKHSTSLPIPYT